MNRVPLIGGKWKGIVLYYLLGGRLRFSELKRQVGDVTQRMLTKQLRELEACGLVNRIVYAEVPPRVEYELTKEGFSNHSREGDREESERSLRNCQSDG